MRMPKRAAAAAILFALALSSPAPAAPADDFAAACGLSGKTSAESCKCQAGLAQASFSAVEMKAAITGVRGDQTAFRAALARMGKTKAKTFLDKMKLLATQASTACS